MGGEAAKAIAQIGMGFMAERGKMQLGQQLEQKQKQDKFALSGAQDLASKGELDMLSGDIQKSLIKTMGKENFGMLQQQNQLNGALRQARRGASQQVQTTQVPIPPEEQAAHAAKTGGTPLGQDPTMRSRVASPEEALQNFNDLGPLGVYLMTGDVRAGQLAQQQAKLVQDKAEFAAAPIRKRNEVLNNLQAKFAGENRRNVRTTTEQAQKLIATGQVPDTFVPFIVDDQAFFVEMPEGQASFGEQATRILAEMGVKDARQATPAMMEKVNKRILSESVTKGASGAVAKAQADAEASKNIPLLFANRQLGESMVDTTTGQMIGMDVTTNDAKTNKKFKHLTDLQRKTLGEVQVARADFSELLRKGQSFFGEGGPLNAGNSGLLARAKSTGTSWWNTATQENPELAAFAAQAGQLAQALNRSSFGGVGTQTEQDRKFAVKSLMDISAGMRLADTPKTAQKKMNDVAQRLDRIEKQILSNNKFVPPGSIYMDVSKPANQELPYAREPLTSGAAQQEAQAGASTQEVAQPIQQGEQTQPGIDPAMQLGQIPQGGTEQIANSLGIPVDMFNNLIQQRPQVTLQQLQDYVNQGKKKQ